MAIQYKIWLYVERHDNETDEYKDIGEPIHLTTFGDRNEAIEQVQALRLDENVEDEIIDDINNDDLNNSEEE
jgi:hypothetical protein